MRFTYHWLNIKTGKRGTSTTALYEYSSEAALLVFLNRCNSQNPGTWQYWY
jgi:hypothetical protein